MKIDLTTDFGKRVERRLREETIVWLTTVRRDGTPQPTPVWFLWDNGTVLMYSQPNQQKEQNIAHSAKVSLNFDGDGHGGNIIVLTGEAQIVANAPPATDVAAYVEKYAEPIKRIGRDAASFAAAYSVAIRITPTDMHGH
ncbi:MAG: TIGR03667 family PPOX class F420-dependent oxidoreductase [Chloroflexota bacterium]|nr:TIGR03667 family PPOX class F420-dependent oxidoreductase [Chloroflexota bacterium]